MGLFDQILGAIDSPEREANPNQLGGILDTVQQLSGSHQTNPSNVQTAMSVIGNFTRSALRQQRQRGGEGQVQNIINQYGGTQPNSMAVQALFSQPQIQQMIGEVTRRTGLNPGVVQSMLPMLVPLVLNFLKTGNNTTNAGAGNPVLNSFIDADGDGDVDIADAMQMASRYLGR